MFVEVVLDLPIHSVFTYKVPSYLENDTEVGKRVIVEFGKKILTGLIINCLKKSDIENVKEIKNILDEERIVNDELIEFCKWISNYYISPQGEVLFNAIPRNINIKSNIHYSLKDDYKNQINKHDLKEEIYFDIINIFEKNLNEKFSRSQIEKRLKYKNLSYQFSKLIELEILETIKLYSKPTKEKIIKIVSKNFDENNFNDIIKDHKIRSLKQIEFLKILCTNQKFKLTDLINRIKISYQSIYSLAQKELIKIIEVREDRDPKEIFSENNENNISLNEEQIHCLDKIKDSLNKNEFKTFLLFGVTGSGKTEVYLNAINEVLKLQKTAIVIVPEISLTPQLIYRFRKRHGDIIGVIHSKLSDGEKLDTFDKINNNKIKIVIGARSALFAPLKNIGIIIVDEEHDSSYKQENSPRYNGRDCAIVRARINNATVILGSATPSIESFYNAEINKYELLTLSERATINKLPEIKIIDLAKRERLKLEGINTDDPNIKKDLLAKIDKVKVKFLAKDLIYEIGERLEKKESIIILQNRRGYHAFLECIKCSSVEMCKRCNIPLTFHKQINLLKCHYCGYIRRVTKFCTTCNTGLLIPRGAGTERVEEELIKLFPTAIIKRMDSDTLVSKSIYQQILKDFYDGKIDILVGTQVISKGLDFPNVTLVGVINADIGLLYPDFRATEKTFQILTQVSGRSGRSHKAGEVLIQTNHSDYFVFSKIKEHDYIGFYKKEIVAREVANYPPFSRIAIVETKSQDLKLAEGKIKEIYNFIRKLDNQKILEMLPPSQPLFSKLKDNYRYHLMIKSIKKNDYLGKHLNNILKEVKNYAENNFPSKVHLTIDIDAINLL